MNLACYLLVFMLNVSAYSVIDVSSYHGTVKMNLLFIFVFNNCVRSVLTERHNEGTSKSLGLKCSSFYTAPFITIDIDSSAFRIEHP